VRLEGSPLPSRADRSRSYELDGLKPMPINHGRLDGGKISWVEKAREVIERRIATYPAGEVSTFYILLTVRHTDWRTCSYIST
jgi:hypothetical protein